MTLPRFWSPSAWINLNETVEISKVAAKFARAQYPIEASWYRTHCGGELPALQFQAIPAPD
jgi:hypothetical protein